MSKETKTNADASAKKKADELAAKLLGEETIPKEESFIPTDKALDEIDTNVDGVNFDASKITVGTTDTSEITVGTIDAKLLQNFKVYDHMVKVNGVYYKAGEQVPIK